MFSVALLQDERLSSRGALPGNGTRGYRGIKQHETVGLFGITFAGIARQNWIWEYGSTAFRDAVVGAAGNELFGRLSLFHPVFQRSERIELGEPWTAATVMNARNKKKPEELFGLLAAAHELHYALVVADRRRRHDRAIGPAMPHENLAAFRFQGAQIEGGCVV